jgi:RNA polymerase sigma-70 factor (ECF subfamily)
MTASVLDGDHPIRHLLVEVAQGNSRAFRTLYQRTNVKMLKTARLVLRNPDDAEDVVQEAFLKIWRRASSYRPREDLSPITWMSTIVRNCAIDAYRARRPGGEEISPDLADRHFNPEQSTLSSERDRQVAALLAQLDDKKGAIVRGAYVDGSSYFDLSVRFNVPLNTVRTRLRRGLQDLGDLARARFGTEMVSARMPSINDAAHPASVAQALGAELTVHLAG